MKFLLLFSFSILNVYAPRQDAKIPATQSDIATILCWLENNTIYKIVSRSEIPSVLSDHQYSYTISTQDGISDMSSQASSERSRASSKSEVKVVVDAIPVESVEIGEAIPVESVEVVKAIPVEVVDAIPVEVVEVVEVVEAIPVEVVKAEAAASIEKLPIAPLRYEDISHIEIISLERFMCMYIYNNQNLIARTINFSPMNTIHNTSIHTAINNFLYLSRTLAHGGSFSAFDIQHVLPTPFACRRFYSLLHQFYNISDSDIDIFLISIVRDILRTLQSLTPAVASAAPAATQ